MGRSTIITRTVATVIMYADGVRLYVRRPDIRRKHGLRGFRRSR